MGKKKDIPLVLLKSLEPFVNLESDKFEVINPRDQLLKVIDKDTDSEFNFTIEKYEKHKNNTFLLYMTRSPRNETDNGLFQSWIEVSGLNEQFSSWVKLLDEYAAVNSFFDDPITKSFKDEFYAEFEIIEDDAKTAAFKTSQILMLDSYLENMDNKLAEFITESNSIEIKEIQSDITILRENLTAKSKKWVVTKLTTIWAKVAKQGTKFIKEFLTESKKELIKQGVKGVIDFVKENGPDLLT